MENLNLTALLAPLPGASPCGRDLESSHELYALEVAAKEPDEPGLKGLSPVDDRDWSAISRQALALLGQSKDLRLPVLLARASLHTGGLGGYCEAIALIRSLLEHYWEQVFPLLEDEGSDGDLRVNTLRELWSPATINVLRSARVLATRELGAITVNDVLLARGATAARPSATATPPQHVAQVLVSAAAAEHALLREHVQSASTNLRWLAEFIGQKLGAQSTIHPKPLVSPADERPTGVLDVLLKALGERTAPAVTAEVDLESSTPETNKENTSIASSGAPSSVMKLVGEARTRDDVLQLLDHVCKYYATYEPSSPVPLLIERARRVSTMSFLDLVRDLADKGLPQVEAWAGKEGKD